MNAKMLYVPQERVHGTIIELLIIFSHCQAVSMATACFRPPKTEEEEISLRFYCLAEYENEQKAQLETAGGNGHESTNVDDLSVPLEHMSANSLNFRLCKFICELRS